MAEPGTSGNASFPDAQPRSYRSRASCRMFALLDLAFLNSPACPGGGYTSVRGCYAKRHLLLMQNLIETDAGDPIFYCTDPFEMMHKLMTRPAYALSTKHSANTGRDILKKVRAVARPSLMLALICPPLSSHPFACQNLVDRVFTLLVPLALGLPLSEPLAPLVDAPHACALTNQLPPGSSPASRLSAPLLASFMLAWEDAVARGVAPPGPWDPS